MTSRIEIITAFEEQRSLVDEGREFIRVHRTMSAFPFFNEAYCGIWAEYNAAIVNNAHCAQRHLISLRAWNLVLDRYGESTQAVQSVLIDYVEPVLFMALDLPGAIREQAHQCAGKLTYLFVSGDESFNVVRDPRHDSCYWRKYHNEHHPNCEEYNAFKERMSHMRYQYGENAQRLRKSHGVRLHDIATLVGDNRLVPMTWESDEGVCYSGYSVDRIKLEEEIQVIDEQVKRAVDVYEALSEYAEYMMKQLIDRLVAKGLVSYGD